MLAKAEEVGVLVVVVVVAVWSSSVLCFDHSMKAYSMACVGGYGSLKNPFVPMRAAGERAESRLGCVGCERPEGTSGMSRHSLFFVCLLASCSVNPAWQYCDWMAMDELQQWEPYYGFVSLGLLVLYVVCSETVRTGSGKDLKVPIRCVGSLGCVGSLTHSVP